VTSIGMEGPRLVGPEVRRSEIRIATVLQVALLALVVGNLVRIPVFTTQAGSRSIPLLPTDVATVALVSIGLATALLQARLRLDAVALIATAFAAMGGLTAIAGVWRLGLTVSDLVISLAFLARWLLYFGVYIVVINSIRERDVLPVWAALENVTVAFAAFGLVQSAFIPNFAQRFYPESVPGVDWDVQGHRLVSSFLDPNFAGMLIVMVLLVELGMLSVGGRVSRWKPLLLVVALIATLSRSSILGFVLGLGTIIMIRGLSKRVMGFVAVCCAGMIALLPALIRFAAQYNKTTFSDPSAVGRLISWAHQLTVFLEHPIIGIGFNTWGPIARERGWVTVANTSLGIEGGLLFVAALTGVVGLVLYLGILMAGAVRARRVWRDQNRQPHERGIAIAMPAIAIAYVFHSLFTNSLFHPFLMEPFWILWGIGFVIADQPAVSISAK
jgi:O-antigen ligase